MGCAFGAESRAFALHLHKLSVFASVGAESRAFALDLRKKSLSKLATFFLRSGRRESNPIILLPKQAYYRYTTPRSEEHRESELSWCPNDRGGRIPYAPIFRYYSANTTKIKTLTPVPGGHILWAICSDSRIIPK